MEEIKGTDVSIFKNQYKTALEVNMPKKVVIEFDGQRAEYTPVEYPIRYGTNPNQPCAIYKPADQTILPIGNMNLLKSGKDGLSLTNVQDMSQALNILKYFPEPACAVMKHINPCGFKVKTKKDESLCDIYLSARNCDSRSAFGSVIGLNIPVDKQTAEAIMSTFVEAVIAPGYEEGVLDIFRRYENTKKLNHAIRIAETKDIYTLPKFEGDNIDGKYNIKTMVDGTIAFESPFLTKIRSIDDFIIDPMVKNTIIKRLPTRQELEDGKIAHYVNISVRSNGIVFVKNGIGSSIATGQQERVGAVELGIAKSIQKAISAEYSLEGSVMSSDAYIPNRDTIDAIAKHKVSAVVWPAGSIADEKIIEAANEYGIALMCTRGERSFSHH